MIDQATVNRKIRRALKHFAIYFVIIFFHYHIDKFTKGYLLIPIILFYLISTATFYLRFCRLLVIGLKNKFRVWTILIPMLMYFVVSVGTPLAWWNRKIPSSELLEKKVVLNGCYEGTMNSATLKLRADSSFEIHWKGAFFSNAWYHGQYTCKGDTIIFKNNGRPLTPINDSLVIVDTFDQKYFIPYKNEFTAIYDNHWFYSGDCQDYN